MNYTWVDHEIFNIYTVHRLIGVSVYNNYTLSFYTEMWAALFVQLAFSIYILCWLRELSNCWLRPESHWIGRAFKRVQPQQGSVCSTGPNMFFFPTNINKIHWNTMPGYALQMFYGFSHPPASFLPPLCFNSCGRCSHLPVVGRKPAVHRTPWKLKRLKTQ